MISGMGKTKSCPLPALTDLNDFFAKLVCDSSSSHDVPFGPANDFHLTAFPRVDPSVVQARLEKLKVDKAPGSDGIPPGLLRSCASVLAPSIAHLINESFRTGTVPAGLKKANITPVLKSPKLDATASQSYRGISLLPAVSKLLEQFAQDTLANFLEDHHIFSDNQFGFRPGHSTEDLLSVAVSDWSRNMDNGLSTVIAFIDLSKAFDRVNHQALLLCLQQCGVGGEVLNWLASYLSNRQQRVAMMGQKCNFLPVQQGVPQGSILGPLLFNLCMAALPEWVKKEVPSSTLLLFADDKTLYAADRSPATAAGMVSSALSAMCAFLSPTGLSLNFQKTVYMVMEPPSRRSISSSSTIKVSCDGLILDRVSKHRCLGVVIDDRLSWSDHVDFVASKVGQKIGCLRRIRRQLSLKACRQYFLGVIQPHLEYCAAAFCTQLSCKDRDRLLALGRRGVRAACGASRDANIHPLLESLQVTCLQDRWLLKLLCFAHNISGTASTSLSKIFAVLNASGCLTRGQATGAVAVPRCATKSGRNAAYNRLALLWNSLPSRLRISRSRAEFKSTMWKLLAERDFYDRCVALAFSPL